ncbi:MAG: FAD-dependent oxidoreductase [Lachnospiraceae bacterium]|nr:FAD-dependent oxidoreductase [Lachnospiraceae bacterium]
MQSIWKNSVKLPSFIHLNKDTKTDVLIIGGGLCGILCAHMLKESGVKYVLVEAEQICSGITHNTTAKITSQHGLIYNKLIQKFGTEKARMYLDANEAALAKFRELAHSIDCDFETKASYVYSLNDRLSLEEELDALRTLNFHAEFVRRPSIPISTAGAVKFNNQAQFNPLRFVAGIAKDLNIYEHTRVTELIGNTAITRYGKIHADKIIVTTHFPFINKHGSYFLKMYQHRSYVLALDNAPNVDGMYVDEDKTGLSFRNYNNLLLLGGGSHRTGKSGGSYKELTAFAKKYYPDANEVCHFATQDCMTLDDVPYIGNYSKRTPNMYVATGFNKWGMTSSMVAATILCDMILGKENPYAPVFSPSRTILRTQLFVNAFESSVNLLTPTKPRCPHLGCALKWNSHERTWDCPCHGSRFTKDGKLIDNPATKDSRTIAPPHA